MTEVCKKPEMCKKCVAAVVVFVLLGAVCYHVHHPRWTGPKPGTDCQVQFKSEYFTGTYRDGVPPEERRIAMSGELVAVKRDAILLRTVSLPFTDYNNAKYRLLWIPKKSILFIEYADNKN